MLKKKERGTIGMCGFENGQDGLQVTEGDVVLECEGPLVVRNLVEPDARSKVRLDLGESHDGAVWNIRETGWLQVGRCMLTAATTSGLASLLELGLERDTVVECKLLG